MSRSISYFSVLFLFVVLCQSGVGLTQSESNDRFKHAAPEKCVGYVAWNAGEEPAIEGNRSQALMVNPDMRAFVDDLKIRAGLLYPAMVSESSLPKLKMEMVHWLSPRIVEAILERSGCLYVEELKLPRGGDRLPVVKAAMLLQPAGDMKRFLKRLASNLKSADDRIEKVTHAGVDAQKIAIEGLANPVLLGDVSGTCLIAMGEASFTGAIERMKAGTTPAWLKEIEEKASKLEHVHTLGYLDVSGMLRAAKKAWGVQASEMADLLGLREAKSIELIGGLNKVNSSLHLLINTADPEGLIGLLANRPVNESIMQHFPADSLFAGAASVDLDDLLEVLDNAMMMVGAPGGFRDMFFVAERELGIDIEDDLVESVGETWGVYNGASDGVLAGTTIVGEATDPEKLTKLVESFFKSGAEKTKEIPVEYRPAFFQQTYNQSQIFSMRFNDLPAETAVCVKDDRFYISLYPSTIKSVIGASSSRQRLLGADQIGQFKESMFLTEPQLTSFAYADSKALMQNAHPFALFMQEVSQIRYGPLGRNQNLKALVGGMQLPPARTVIEYLDSAMGFVRSGKNGVEIEIRQTVSTNFAGAAVPVLVGGFLPSVGGARSAAQDAQSQNNLRHIALACLNYESAHQKFPANIPEIGNDESENRFSWRVHILPYIEQNNLYQQIRFDEPWDSEHNKTLMELMPATYKSPGSNAAAGMTVYRGFGGESGILGGDEDERVGFANITDGSSNTILVHEVDEELATPWMKPECLATEEAVLESIFGKHKSRNAAMADGSVHRIPSTIEVEKLSHLVQRDDGNVVDLNFRGNQWRRELPEPDGRFVRPGVKKQY